MSLLDFKGIAKIFEQIELRLISSLKRNLKRHKSEEEQYGFEWSAWQAEKLKNMENFRRQNMAVMEEYTDVIDEQTRQLMTEQFDEGQRLAEENVPDINGRARASDTYFFGINEKKMQALMNDITTVEKNVQTAALRMTGDIYRQTINRVQLEMSTGSITLTQAVDLATRDFLDKGINCIVYSDGKRVNITDYVRMVLRTTSTRATLQGQAKRFAELGYDTVLVSQYGGCSKTCEPWQGRVYIDDVFTVWDGERKGDRGKSNYCGKWFPLLSLAIRGGLFHPNCRHTMTQYIDGVTKIPAPIPAEKIAKQRELEQKQRAMERNIRKLKRFAEGTLDHNTAKAYRKKVRQAQQELKVFIEEHNEVLHRDYSREKVYSGEEKPKQAGQGIDVTKNIYVKGGFEKTVAIPDDIKNEIVSSIEKIQREYDVKIDEISLEDISREYGKVPFQFYPINENGKFKSKFLINEGFNWEMNLDKMNERIYNKNYKKGVLASQNINDLIAHEMAHFMSFQSCETYNDFLLRERQLRSLYISGVSGYSDVLEDGAETIAEGFVRIRNNETVDDRVKSLVNKYVERWKR